MFCVVKLFGIKTFGEDRMNEQIKNFPHWHCVVIGLLFGILMFCFGYYRCKQNLYNQWSKTVEIRQQLEAAQRHQQEATDAISRAATANKDTERKIGESREISKGIQRSIEDGRRSLNESARLLDECQSIIDEVVDAGEGDPAED